MKTYNRRKVSAFPSRIRSSSSDFWALRSVKYDELEWATSADSIQELLDFACIKNDCKVLEIGCGTGLVSERLAEQSRQVICIDVSPDMLDQARSKRGEASNVNYSLGDARDLDFPANSFDRIIARMAFHHITPGIDRAFSECFRLLKPGGILGIQEGIPPAEQCVDWYTRMFKLKETRMTFTPYRMFNHFHHAGFVNISQDFFVIHQASVRNWLEKSGLSVERQEQIFDMHRDAPEQVKEAYSMVETSNDVLIDMVMLTTRGIKPRAR
ncbi:MAG: class I SAM-dependent methyltransferase [Candidatus Odinarchaeota archaeon]